MKIALGQFAVRPDWQDNAAICLDLIARADAGGARLLVLPEGILARDIADPDLVRRAAQPLDGPFMTRMLEATRDRALTLVMTVHVPADQGKVWNIRSRCAAVASSRNIASCICMTRSPCRSRSTWCPAMKCRRCSRWTGCASA